MTRDELRKLVSWKPPVSIDYRRTVYETSVQTFVSRDLYFRFAETGEPVVGNHYHVNGRPRVMEELGGAEISVAELFRVREGYVKCLILQDTRTGEVQVVESFLWEGRLYRLVPGTCIVIPTYVAHAFLMAPGTVMTGLATVDYNGDDTKPWKLMDERGKLVATPRPLIR